MSGKSIRIDKFLSSNGFGSRNDVKKLLHTKTVCVNGAVCTDCKTHLVLLDDVVTVNGTAVFQKEPLYIMLNKKAGTVTANRDNSYATIFDLISEELIFPYKKDELFAVGRLDLDTEGLLIITSEGGMVHRLTAPKNNVPKTYFARLEKSLTKTEQSEYVRCFKDGIHINADRGEPSHDCKSAQLHFISANEAELTITEGKNRQVKRMFSALQNTVTYLKRICVGGLQLDPQLQTGQARKLTQKEVELL